MSARLDRSAPEFTSASESQSNSESESESANPAYPQALHIHPTAELAERVLLPGDPGRALALAQVLIETPKMFNHHRGLWGYTGPARTDGELLTIQATGMGGPSAAIVLSELIALGTRRAVRVGTCGALEPGLQLGELVIASEALCRDGASRGLGAGERVAADPGLTTALAQAAAGAEDDGSVSADGIFGARAHVGAVMSVDLFYDPEPDRGPHRLGPVLGESGGTTGVLAVEMEAATLFAIGARARVPVGCALVVTDTFDALGVRTRIEEHSLLEAAERMGAVAMAALAS
jgi:uridine phosphorylase